VHNLVTEDSLVSRSSEFEAAVQNGERSLLRVLCDKKSQESEYVIFAGHYFSSILFF
jgi:protein transport protein SEC31